MSSDCILGAKKPHTSIDKLEAEWAEANEFSRQLEALRTAGGHGARAVSNLVGQVAVVHSVVWEKAQDIIVQLQQRGSRPTGPCRAVPNTEQPHPPMTGRGLLRFPY